MSAAEEHWAGRSVLVTGGTGLLGGWLVRSLVLQGANVVALIRDRAPSCMLLSDGWVDRVVSVDGDLSEIGPLRRILAEHEVETVFHLAAQTIVGTAKKDPVGTLEANVRGTWNLLEAARQVEVGEIVVASSDKAYGTSDNLPYTEDQPLQGLYPYDVSKSCTDLISTMYAATYDVPVAITRCGNIFGGGDLNFSRTVPGAVIAALRNQPFEIRSDGKSVRDYIYVEDVVSAYETLAMGLCKDRSLAGEGFNFSVEKPLDVLELVSWIHRLMDHKLDPVILNIAKAEIAEQFLSAEKARKLLSWEPKFGIEEGLKRSIDWYRKLEAQNGGSPD